MVRKLSSTPSTGIQYVRIEDLIRDARALLHQGYTMVELKDSIVYHPVRGAQPLSDHVHSSLV